MTECAAAGAPHHWTVDPGERALTTCVLDDSGAFRPTAVLTPGGPPARLDLEVAALVLDVAVLLGPRAGRPAGGQGVAIARRRAAR